ncbi:hypothetical protein GLOIN_2v1670896, partial [Rhizophagus irregularis DAOM 181602=DAOM 197198]
FAIFGINFKSGVTFGRDCTLIMIYASFKKKKLFIIDHAVYLWSLLTSFFLALILIIMTKKK